MKIEHEFTVDASIDIVWGVLTDIPAIAPCMPGATLLGAEPDDAGHDVFSGKVKVKIGPVVSEYKGTASFISKDDATHQAVIDAKGRDSRGAGNAAAVITMSLRPDGGSPERTTVTVDTDLKISGKIAQFGSSMIREVSEKLLGQFVGCLEGELRPAESTATEPISVQPASALPPTPGAGPDLPVASVASGTQVQDRPHLALASAEPGPEPEPLDLLELAGGAAAKRLVPLGVAALAALAVIVYVFRR